MSVGVWGYGREGRAALDWLIRTGVSDIVVYDDRALGEVPAGLTARFADLAACERVFVSPGVAHTDPRRAALIEAGVELQSGTQLWMRDHHAQTIGITGTKGKSTTSSLIHHLLRATGRPNELAGNIGIPLLDVPEADRYVVELSSYQCQTLDQSPAVGVITQLAWDHVPMHGTVEAYWQAKARIFTEHGRILICARNTLDSLREVGVDVSAFDVRITEPLADVPSGWPAVLTYPHNRANAALALAAAEAVGVERAELLRAGASFMPLEHRLEEIAETARGIVWVSDVLATTQESAVAAVNTFAQHPITLIIGGQDRGQPIDQLAARLAVVQQTGSARVICMASCGPRFADDLREAQVRDVHLVETLDQAVGLANDISDDQAVVLLSPAAPSYDQFRDYAAKAAALRDLVAAL